MVCMRRTHRHALLVFAPLHSVFPYGQNVFTQMAWITCWNCFCCTGNAMHINAATVGAARWCIVAQSMISRGRLNMGDVLSDILECHSAVF